MINSSKLASRRSSFLLTILVISYIIKEKPSPPTPLQPGLDLPHGQTPSWPLHSLENLVLGQP